MILLCLLLLEVMLRVSNPPIVRGFIRQPDIYEPNETVGYLYRPMSNGMIFRDGNYRVNLQLNNRGFHDVDFVDEKPDGVTRVAVIGDSFSAGLHVERDKSFANQLDVLLAEDCNCEVYNFGVDGFGVHQERAIFEDYVLDYQPDVVVHQIYDNDITDAQLPLIFRES
jgi:hypothetical protein